MILTSYVLLIFADCSACLCRIHFFLSNSEEATQKKEIARNPPRSEHILEKKKICKSLPGCIALRDVLISWSPRGFSARCVHERLAGGGYENRTFQMCVAKTA